MPYMASYIWRCDIHLVIGKSRFTVANQRSDDTFLSERLSPSNRDSLDLFPDHLASVVPG